MKKYVNFREIGFIALFLVLMGLCVLYTRTQVFNPQWWRGSGLYMQKVQLPDPEVVKVATLGYENLYADYLTLQAIQQYGAGWRTPDDSSEPIYDFFKIIANLDPHFQPVYEFGNLVLSDDRGEHDLGMDILEEGIFNNYGRPDAWKLANLGIYTALWGANDPGSARRFLNYARAFPDTPAHVLRMEEYIERVGGNYEDAFHVNLGFYLDYVETGSDFEQDIALMRFKTILNEWYRTELAKGARAFLEQTGEHPEAIEDILPRVRGGQIMAPFLKPFRAPTMERVEEVVKLFREENPNRPLRSLEQQIRSAVQETIVGLPPEPHGTWYYIDLAMRDYVTGGNYDVPTSAPLIKQFPYILSLKDELNFVDIASLKAQEKVMMRLQNNEPPPTEGEMAQFLGFDGAGGHYVYRPSGGENDLPEFYSTTTRRVLDKTEPRLGMRGTLDQFPRRPEGYNVEGMPPYFQAEPSMWDYPVDIEWARGLDFVEGIQYHRQPPELIQAAEARKRAALQGTVRPGVGGLSLEEIEAAERAEAAKENAEE